MNSQMLDAFAKTGKFDKEIESLNKKRQEEQEKLDQEKKLEDQHRRENNRISDILNREDTKFDLLLKKIMNKNEQTKNFIFHLICSHIPYAMTVPVDEADESKRNKKCCLCEKETVSMQESLKMMMDSKSDFFLKRIQLNILAHEQKWSAETMEFELSKLMDSLVGEKAVGYTSEATSTVLCRQCVISLRRWIENEMCRGNRFVLAAVNKRKHESFICR